MSSDLRKMIREVLESTSHEWMPASKETLMLDKPGIEDSDKENQEQYLKSLGLMEGAVAGKILIPPPPSDKFRASELSVIADQYNNRKNPEVLQGALDDGFDQLFDMIVTSAGYPSILPTIKSVSASLVPTIRHHKDYFAVPRPTEFSETIGYKFSGDELDSARNFSYPSGHATQAFYLAHFLSDIHPDLSSDFLKLAQMVCDSRIDRGVHFPSDIEGGKKLARILFDSTRDQSTTNLHESVLAKVRGYMKPEISFFTLEEWGLCVELLLKLQKEGVDVRGSLHPDPRLNLILEKYFWYQLDVEVDRWDLLTEKNVLDFIEDFTNHRYWGLEKEFGHYFPDISKLRFAYFYSRGDMEPYVLLDDEYTKQMYGSVDNPKELMHYTTMAGVKRIAESIEGDLKFDISTFTVAKRPFFRPESNIILKMLGNVRAGFRSDIKSMAIDSGRRACNLHRLEYPGKDLNNICYELESCDGEVRTSLWNEYIATPIQILEVMELKL